MEHGKGRTSPASRSFFRAAGPLRCDFQRSILYRQGNAAKRLHSGGRESSGSTLQQFPLASLAGLPTELLLQGVLTKISPEDMHMLRGVSPRLRDVVEGAIDSSKRYLLNNSIFLSVPRRARWSAENVPAEAKKSLERLNADAWLRFFYKLVYFPYTTETEDEVLPEPLQPLTWREPYKAPPSILTNPTYPLYEETGGVQEFEVNFSITVGLTTLNLILFALGQDDILLLHGVWPESAWSNDPILSRPIPPGPWGFSVSTVSFRRAFTPFPKAFPYHRFIKIKRSYLEIPLVPPYRTLVFSHMDMLQMAILAHRNRAAAYIMTETPHLLHYNRLSEDLLQYGDFLHYAKVAAFAFNRDALRLTLLHRFAWHLLGDDTLPVPENEKAFRGFWTYLTDTLWSDIYALGQKKTPPYSMIDMPLYREFLEKSGVIDLGHGESRRQRDEAFRRRFNQQIAEALPLLLEWIVKAIDDENEFLRRASRVFGSVMVQDPASYFEKIATDPPPLRATDEGRLVAAMGIVRDATMARSAFAPDSPFRQFLTGLRLHAVSTDAQLETLNGALTSYEEVIERRHGARGGFPTSSRDFFEDAFTG